MYDARGLLAALVLLGGCGPSVVEMKAIDGTSSSGTLPTSSGVVDETLGTSASSGDTTGSTTAPGSSSSGEFEASSTGALVACEDLPGADFMLLVSDEPPPGEFDTRVDAPCLVAAVEDVSDLAVHYTLQCDEGGAETNTYVFEVTSFDGQARPLVLDETVRFRTYRNYPIDYGLETATLVTSLDGQRIAGSYTWPVSVPRDVAAWFEVTVEPFDAGCATVVPDPPGNSFITDPCPRYSTRLGANVVWDQESVALLPGTRTDVGGLMYSGSFSDVDYVDDATCFPDGVRGRVAFYRPRRG